MNIKFYFILYLLVMIFFVSGCSTITPSKNREELNELMQQTDLSLILQKNLYAKYGAYKNQTLEDYLTSLIEKIINVNSDLRPKNQIAYKVGLLNSDGLCMAFDFENRIYFCKGVFDKVQYENELVFIISLQLVQIKSHVLISNYNRNKYSVDNDLLAGNYFLENGLYDFGQEEYSRFATLALHAMYKTRYDARGAISFLERVKKLPFGSIDFGPFIFFSELNFQGYPQKIGEHLDFSYQLNQMKHEVAMLSPLRNPIVSTVLFENIFKTIKSKKLGKN